MGKYVNEFRCVISDDCFATNNGEVIAERSIVRLVDCNGSASSSMGRFASNNL